MCYISATRDPEGNSGITSVRVEDILYLGVDSRSAIIIIETIQQTYYTTGTLRYWTHVLNKTGYNFLLADRNNSIQVPKIVEVNELTKIAYFDINDKSKYCTMSRSGLKEVLGIITKLNTSVLFT